MTVNLERASNKVLFTDYLNNYYYINNKVITFHPSFNAYNIIIFLNNYRFIIYKRKVIVMPGNIIEFSKNTAIICDIIRDTILSCKTTNDHNGAILTRQFTIDKILKHKALFFEKPLTLKKLCFNKKIKNLLSTGIQTISNSIETKFEKATHLPVKEYNLVERVWCQKHYIEYNKKGFSEKKEYVTI